LFLNMFKFAGSGLFLFMDIPEWQGHTNMKAESDDFSRIA